MPTANLIRATENYPRVLHTGQLAATDTLIYQCPPTSSVTVSTATVCNTSDIPQTVSLSVVKAGGVSGVANRVAIIDLEPDESSSVEELLVFLGPGDFISGLASEAASVSIVLTGAVSS